MNKSSIALLSQTLAAKDGLTISEAERFIKQMFDVAYEGVQSDKLLKIKWLGTFKVMNVKDRESVDVNTGERIVIEGREKISFTPDNILKEIVNKPFAQFETVIVGDDVDFSDIDAKYEDEEDVTEEKLVQEEGRGETTVIEPVTKTIQEPAAEKQTFSTEETSVIEDDTPIIDEEILDTKEPTPESEEVVPTVEIEPTDEHSEPSESSENSEPKHNRHVMVIPKTVVFVTLAVIVFLMAGMCWFAFSYGKMSAQRDHLASQLEKLNDYKVVPKLAKEPNVLAEPVADRIDNGDSISAVIKTKKEKTQTDSIRKAKELLDKKAKADSIAKVKAKQQKADDQNTVLMKYDSDARVRTGAYRIVGVAQTVIVKKGQSLASLSKLYLGPGMECYVEVLNACTSVKEGQKVKIPKLELKKRRSNN